MKSQMRLRSVWTGRLQTSTSWEGRVEGKRELRANKDPAPRAIREPRPAASREWGTDIFHLLTLLSRSSIRMELWISSLVRESPNEGFSYPSSVMRTGRQARATRGMLLRGR
jgi:hypothetical protein